MSESFDEVLEVLRQEYASVYSVDILARLQFAHAYEMEQARQSYDISLEQARKAEYHRGYEDGQRSMDAEHRAVCHKLMRVALDGDSNTMLSRLAYAIYPCATGWTGESCEGLREHIIELLGGVHEPVSVRVSGGACADGCRDSHGQSETVDVDDSVSDARADVPAAGGVADPAAAQVMYDVLDNERHKAVCRLREWRPDEDGRPYREFWEAVMGEELPTVPLKGDAELRKSLRKIAEHAGVPHDLELSTYDDDTVAKATVQLVGMLHKHIKTLEAKLDATRETLDE